MALNFGRRVVGQRSGLGHPAAQYQLVHSFCLQSNCQDGRNPQAGLIRDSEGNFYGTAEEAGNIGVGQNGVAFKLTFNNGQPPPERQEPNVRPGSPRQPKLRRA